MTRPVAQPGWYPDPSGAPGQRYFDGARWSAHYAPAPVGVNNGPGLGPPRVATGPNHALHLILTLLTCGWWLPVWLILAITRRDRVRPTGQGNIPIAIGGVIAGMYIMALAEWHFVWFLVLVALTGLGYLGYRIRESAVRRRTEHARVAARADAEHRAILSGNPYGLYGQYPPPLLPELWT